MKYLLVKSKHVSQAISWIKRREKILEELLVNLTGSQESPDQIFGFIHVTLIHGLKHGLKIQRQQMLCIRS